MENKIGALIKYFKKPMPLKNNFEDYNSYWKHRGFAKPAINRGNLISPRIQKNKNILDIGCGDGSLMQVLIKKNSPNFIYGIDISKEAINHVKSNGMNGRVIDIQSNNFEKFLKSQKFDYIIITEVLEHIQNPEKVIEIIKEYCPNAIIFISIPNAGFITHRLRLLFGKFPLVVIVEHIKEHIRFWTHSDFKYWINYLGFELKDYFVCAGLYYKPLKFLETMSPSLFAQQIIYEIRKKNEK